MRQYFRLLGIQMRQRYGLSSFKAGLRERRGRTLGMIAVWLIAILSIAMLLGMYVWLLTLLMPAFIAVGMGTLLLGLALLISMVFVFFMGLVYLIGMLFFSKDTEFLASLPIPQQTVFAAKFTQVLMGEIVTGLVILLPPFIIYGIETGQALAYWLRMVVISLTAPCIPLALSGLLSLLLMRFNALWRRRELLTVVGSILLVVVIIVGQGMLTAMLPEDMSMAAMMQLVADSESVLRMVVSAFPPSGWAAEGLVGNSGMFALFLAVSVVALALVVWLAGKIYYGGAMAQLETASKRKAVLLTGKSTRQHGAMRALVAREWRTVLRSPVYALNGLMTIVIGPLMLIIPKLFQGTSNGDELDAVFSMLESAVDPRIVLLLLAAIFMAISMINPAVTTSLSREGKSFAFLRMIPVSPARQVMAKYLFGLSIAVVTMVFMGGVAMLMLGFSVQMAGGAFLLGLIASIAPLALSLLPDIVRPKLSWNSETEAMKQNLNSMLGMVIGWGYTGLLAFGCYKLMEAGVDLSVLIAGLAGLSLLLGGAMLWVLCMAARRTWRVIEG